jgi:hypothetical protein
MLSLMETVFPRTSLSSPPSWSNIVERTTATCRSYSGQIPMATRLVGGEVTDAKTGLATAAAAAIPIAPRKSLLEQCLSMRTSSSLRFKYGPISVAPKSDIFRYGQARIQKAVVCSYSGASIMAQVIVI